MSLSTTQYKGIAVLSAMLAAGTTLWFARTDVHIKAVDAAEIGAGAVDIACQSGVSEANWMTAYWDVDRSTTNSWGGFSNVTVDGESFFFSIRRMYLDGKTNLGGVAWENECLADCVDIYTNSTADKVVLDYGPAGVPQASGKPISWKLASASTVLSNAYAWTLPDNTSWGSGTVSNRVRHYCPRILRPLTNTVNMTFDMAEIDFVRETLQSDAMTEDAGWIVATNADANYDGVGWTLIKDAWATNYLNWASGYSIITNVTIVSTNPVRVTVTNYMLNPNAVTFLDDFDPVRLQYGLPYGSTRQIFVTTNELAWHYSAMHRMRDQVRTPTKYVYKWAHHMEACTSTEWNNYGGFAWALSYSRLESWWNNGNPATDTGVFTSTTYSTTYPVGTLLRAICYYNFSGTAYDFNPIEFYTCVLTGVEVDGLYSAVSHKGDFLGLSWYPYQLLPTFKIPPHYTDPPQTEWMDYSSQMKSNAWSQWDTVPATTGSLVSTQQLGSWTLPPYTDIPDLSQWATRSHVGYTLVDVRAIVRWQQRACTNAVFDARYQ